MVKTNKAALLLLLFVAIAAAWWLWPNDSRQIEKHLNTLIRLSEKQGPEQGAESLTKAAKISGLFTHPCRVIFEETNYSGDYHKKEIIDRVLFIRNQSTTLHLSFHDLAVTVGEDKTAEVVTTVQVDSGESEELFRDIREVALKMKKQDGNWLISGVTFIQVLEQ